MYTCRAGHCCSQVSMVTTCKNTWDKRNRKVHYLTIIYQLEGAKELKKVIEVDLQLVAVVGDPPSLSCL